MKDKDCIFLLADGQMRSTFKGFFGRKDGDFHLSLGTRRFTPEIMVHSSGRDSGVYTDAHNLLRYYCRTHQHAVVVLDNAWEGSPGVDGIRKTIKHNLTQNGWQEEDVEVVVIEPELEIWLLQDSPHVVNALKLPLGKHPTFKAWLEAEGFWFPQARKFIHPKEAFERMFKVSNKRPSGAIYGKIAEDISISHCTDPAFCLLWAALKRWFPQEEDQLWKG